MCSQTFCAKGDCLSKITACTAIGDVLAICGFFFTIIYFARIADKNGMEKFLLGFGVSGFVADLIFTTVEFANWCGVFGSRSTLSLG